MAGLPGEKGNRVSYIPLVSWLQSVMKPWQEDMAGRRAAIAGDEPEQCNENKSVLEDNVECHSIAPSHSTHILGSCKILLGLLESGGGGSL